MYEAHKDSWDMTMTLMFISYPHWLKKKKEKKEKKKVRALGKK